MSAFGEGPDEDRMFCLDSWTVRRETVTVACGMWHARLSLLSALSALSLSNLRTNLTTIDNAAER